MKRARNWILGTLLPPAAFFALVLLLWQLATSVWELPSYLVPTPLQVFEAGHEHFADLVAATRLTGAGALAGFALGLVFGTAIGLLFSQSRIIERSLYPYAIFLQTVPIVAIAPVIVMWFGHGFSGVVAVSFILSLFPIITNATAGLTAIDANLLELFEIYDAGALAVLLKLRLPNAVGYLVTGAKISCGLSVIGAIVGEISAGFGTESFGLGYVITAATGKLDTAYAFAAILCSTLLSLAIFTAVTLLGNWILARWHVSGPRRSTDTP
jgi:NitT/TauT family transport system permease protein